MFKPVRVVCVGVEIRVVEKWKYVQISREATKGTKSDNRKDLDAKMPTAPKFCLWSRVNSSMERVCSSSIDLYPWEKDKQWGHQVSRDKISIYLGGQQCYCSYSHEFSKVDLIPTSSESIHPRSLLLVLQTFFIK